MGSWAVLKCKLAHHASDDPIVFPGQPGGSHLHSFFGARDANAFSTYESMRAGGTTCPLSADTAGYWVPTLRAPTGEPAHVKVLNVYYRAPTGVSVRPFPPDLRIVAGGDAFNPPDPTASQRSLSWSCVDRGPFFTSPPTCTQGAVRAHIHFPSCLAADLPTDSPDHRSHMVYGSRALYGTTWCPSGYVPVPRVTYHVVYGITDGAGYRLSSDMDSVEGGRTLHADFWNTWDQAVLEFLVERCLNAGENCKSMTDDELVALGWTG